MRMRRVLRPRVLVSAACACSDGVSDPACRVMVSPVGSRHVRCDMCSFLKHELVLFVLR